MKIKKGWYALFTAPLMIMFCIIVIIPFFTGMGYSLVSWDGLAKSEKVFVGLSNYAKIFSDKQFLTSLVRTTLFTLITVVIVNVLALAFAVLVTTKLKVRNVAMAALTFTIIPVIIFYLLCQKHIIKGVAAGAVKG